MEDQSHHSNTTKSSTTTASSSSTPPSSEPARSRWTPKPEQILILESIFNSGTVNPSKDDTVRIRRLLEKFGPVGDANVFYWFQNRRSRSRRRQRQLQAAATSLQPTVATSSGSGRGVIPFQYFNNNNNDNNNNNNNNVINNNSIIRGCQLAPSSSSECLYGFGSNEAAAGSGGVFSISDQNPNFAFHHPPSSGGGGGGGGGGIITVFVNGVATQVPAGSFDVKTMFGHDLVLLHSTGVPVPVNDFGFCFHGLHHGDAYFLVPRVA